MDNIANTSVGQDSMRNESVRCLSLRDWAKKWATDLSDDVVRVFVGADRSQLLAVKVLEYSIKRHTQLPVEVYPMVDLPVRVPADPLNWQRTGFSFSRFCIPELAGYRGKALYLDADMMVFKDIASLWQLPFDGARVIIQAELPEARQQTNEKVGAPKQRVKQCAVMLLDCDRLDWNIDDIIDGFDQGRYDYEKLMYDLCILPEDDIKYAVPFHWNSMEHYAPGETSLIHYTDMATQPWVYAQNEYGSLWLAEVRRMLSQGALTRAELKKEIALGYFRPSLMMDLDWGHRVPSVLRPQFELLMRLLDKPYKPHKEVYRQKKIRVNAVKEKQAMEVI
ncbi:MAG: glycosyltransferase [Phormidesmis sp.]